MTDDNGLRLTTTGKRVVDEEPYGCYAWRMPNGAFVADDEGHFYLIQAMRGDKKRIQSLADGVRSFGIDEGEPVFFAGHRIVTDDEYEEQKQRLRWGLTPDKYDLASVREDRDVNHRR